MPRRYECLDADCGHIIVAADQAALIAAVQDHMSEAHDSFELEDVIVDTSTEVSGEEAASQEVSGEEAASQEVSGEKAASAEVSGEEAASAEVSSEEEKDG